jgi:DNA polymerase-3 subunit beta
MSSITLDTADAKRVTALAMRATEPGHPILSAVHIGLLDGQATLTSRSRSLAIETVVDAISERSGCILVGAKRLADVIGRCPGDTVTLAPTEGGLIITSGRWKATLPTIPPAEFDAYPLRLEGGNDAEVFQGDGLLAALAAVTLAASTEHNRPLLTAVHLAPQGDDGCRFVATDSYRLATRYGGVYHGPPVNIPADTLRLLATIHTPGDEIELTTTARSIRIQTGNTTIVSQLIEGQYPDWQGLVHNNKIGPTGLLTVEDPEDLGAAVTRSGKTFGGDMGLVKLTMHPDAIDVEASAADVGIGTETVPATWTGPDGFAITFNSRLLAEGLRSFAGPVVATVLDEMKPTVIRSPDGDPDDIYLQMPLRRP